MLIDATTTDIDKALKQAWSAFHIYRKFSLKRRASFMKAIAKEIENLGDELLKIAGEETNLPEARLRNERARTIFQLTSYAEACERGDWLDIRIDTAIADRTPPKPDLRKMLVPLGPVVVFGAANFPFAYSTAGGDTGCAFAAGCPVIVKAHPAHARTSDLVAGAIMKAAEMEELPPGVFAHLHGAGNGVGEALVKHPLTKAVGFTGSFLGGKQLFDWANQRKEPIPVFAEMSSINPVFLFPKKLKASASEIAQMYAASITLGVGQFCTNPGLIIGVDGEDLQQFIHSLADQIQIVQPGKMLHEGIYKNYSARKEEALAQQEVETIAVSAEPARAGEGAATIATATAEAFIKNPILHQEVFGPYSIVIRCKNVEEMTEVAKNIEGQLTSTIMGTEEDIRDHGDLMDSIKNICGRLILNSVPTGVEVCLSMHHGGPFPATTDSRFTAVGADGIKRFARPICYQNWPNELLPDELKNENFPGIYRTVNNELTKAIIVG